MPFDNPNQAPVGDLDILIVARGSISGNNSWVKGCYNDGDRRCLIAALSLACHSKSFQLPNQTERRLARMLVKHLPSRTSWWLRFRLLPPRRRLMTFNDHPRTTHDDVLAVYDETIRQLASRVPEYVRA